MKLDGRLPYEHCVTRKGKGSYWRSCSIVFVNRFEQPGHELVPAQIQNRYQISFLTPTIHSWSRGESGVECCLLQFQRLRNTTKDVFPLLPIRPPHSNRGPSHPFSTRIQFLLGLMGQ